MSQPRFFSSARASVSVALTVFALALGIGNLSVAHAKPKASANPQVVMSVASRGDITIELYPKAAPKTVAHFLELVNKKFYDGILFHRVVPDFVAQAGDPKTKGADGAALSQLPPGGDPRFGSGGSGKNVPLEVKMAHDRGTLGLARAQDPNTGDSQFFLNLVPNHSLDSGYCVFGKVVKGLDVMDSIKQGDKITSIRVVAAKKK